MQDNSIALFDYMHCIIVNMYSNAPVSAFAVNVNDFTFSFLQETSK